MSVQNPSTSKSREESPLAEHDYSNGITVKLWLKLSTNSEWTVILAIQPLSWLRFLGFAIYGREGMLFIKLKRS